MTRSLGIPALVFLVIMILVRLALPYAVRDFVNKRLQAMQGYRGRVEKIRISLYRGAYTIVGLRIVKTSGKVPVPFVTIPEMDLAVQWEELFHGNVVGTITMNRPAVNFATGPTEQQKQSGLQGDWEQTLKSISPFTINKFQINDGNIRFLDPYRQPPVNIFITNLFATATNLTNVHKKGSGLPGGLIVRGNTIGGGALAMELHMNPLAAEPTFKLQAVVTNMDLTALNNFFNAYAAFDVARGKFALLTDVAAADGSYQGYAKPFLFDLKVLSLHKEVKSGNPLHVVWEGVVALVGELFRNQPQNQIATVVPISGTFQKGTSIGLWSTIGGILQNAFVQALSPKFVQPVPMPGGSPPAQASARGAGKH